LTKAVNLISLCKTLFVKVLTNVFWNKANRSKNEAHQNEFIPFNIYKTSFEKRALVSFISYPFRNRENILSHTNINECITLCELLNNLGYIVDIVDYNDRLFKVEHKYNLLVGFGEPIERVLHETINKDFTIILYRNGCDTSFSDQESLKRIEKVLNERGKLLLNSARVNNESWRAQVRFADSLIVLGNSFVANTFRLETSGKISSLNLFYHDVGVIDLRKKNFNEAKNNFLWFGSKGAIHKGLDLLLNYFEMNKDKKLFICGLHSSEVEFLDTYKSAFEQNNIFNLGFVAIDSIEFKDLLYKCNAVVLPSASEGGGGSILNVIAVGGLVPIITKNVGLDFEQNEILIEGFSDELISKSINQFSCLSSTETETRANFLRNYIREKHSFQNYRSNIRRILIESKL
jgi:glycosyltransferase involved in cell wall biosynthesis